MLLGTRMVWRAHVCAGYGRRKPKDYDARKDAEKALNAAINFYRERATEPSHLDLPFFAHSNYYASKWVWCVLAMDKLSGAYR